MKLYILLIINILVSICIQAQEDPVLLKIHNKKIFRSEFEYSLNKHGKQFEGNIKDFLNDFINRKILSEAARDKGLDTTFNFRRIYNYYKNKQNSITSFPDKGKSLVEVNNPDKIFHISQIFIALPQDASADYQQRVKNRMDSIYDQVLREKSFNIVASHFETCGMPAKSREYVLSSRNKTYKEVEQVIFDLKEGEISKPFLSPAGYYIVKIEPSQTQERKTESNKVNVYLLHEYEDGLLSQEFMKSNEKISEEEYQKSLINYYNTHKKDYSISTACFEGMLIQGKTSDLTKRLKKKLKKMPVENRMKFIRTECNIGSIHLVKAIEGLFVKGDNPIVDKLAFKGSNYKVDSQYPYAAIIGKKKKRKQFLFSEVKQQVEIDYQEKREKDLLADLRQKYDVQINKSVLDTVNKHL